MDVIDFVRTSDKPVLVDFWAAWCGPCRQLRPVVRALGEDRDDLLVVEVDADAEPAVAARYAVLAMPTLILFRDGEPVGRWVGTRSRRRLEEELDRALQPAPAQ